MKNRIIRGVAMLAILCVMVTLVAVPLASAASYTNVYGKTTDKIRVRQSASTNATIIDNIIKNACVYVLSTVNSGNNTFAKIKYRNSDGDVTTGWACQSDGKTTYIKILSDEQVYKTFGVKVGKKSGDVNLPSKKVGTFTAAERKASSSTTDNTYIKLNSSGTAVKTLQTKLKKLGYYTATETGNAGPKTVAAIKKFQAAYGLTADGVAGPATLAKIDAAYDKLGTSASSGSSASGLRLNSTGNDVRDLQDNLTALGYYWATISGNFGPKTETAVKRFQEENGLTVDGVAGKKTLDAIAEAVAKSGKVSSTSKDNSSVLKLNSESARVGQLQSDLKNLGYYTAEVTKHFGAKTEAAVKKFQSAHGLTADGIAGPKTLDAIDDALAGKTSGSSSSGSTLKLGVVSDKVADLQTDLTTLGFYYGDITKHFGSLTQQAVKKFQKSRGLTQDGIAGAKTLTAIASAVAGTGNSSAIGGSNSSGTSLRRGDTNNPKIGDMQQRLTSLGYYYGDITNDFGPLTEQAVKKFQDDNGLTVDGIAGTDTLNKLYSLTGGSSNTSTPGTSSSVSLSNSYGRIIKDNVYLRSKASTSSDAKASLGQGTLVRINQKYTTTDNVVWYKITVKSGNYTYTGYVRNDMIESITESEYNSAGGSSDNNYSDMEVLGMIKVTADKVRLRYSPDTDSEIVGQANKDDVFYYVNSVSGWFQTKAGYWISSSYAKVMTSDEVKDYNGTVSSGSGTTTYRNGSTGTGVLEIQTMLNTLQYYYGKLSGNYGDLTEEAVRLFQKDHGLSADGVAGPKTIAAIKAAYSASFGGSDASTSYNDIIYNLSYTKNSPDKTGRQIMVNLGLKARAKVKLTDVTTGLSFNIDIQSVGSSSHVDAEPVTASDTATMCRIFGVSVSEDIPWYRRAMILTVGGEQFLCSVYGQPHGQANITNNNFTYVENGSTHYGQFCIHFKDSSINAGDGGSVPDSMNHQAIIAEAASSLDGSTLGGKTVKVSTSYATSQAQ